ncbi:hypothetical protein HK099_004402 [Clydaea vesicula]|uniref:Septin-type G domain-containing protein n=1 Tax=Clydaea vesicula TaxID=447962 RepID=A0AAD5U2E5_9FUNG|nr:hypothetical protein HK099_004402 [Clydaea vesicula]KAJ3391093.1 hypothetical protein HDU92_000159 [Lobulomyces angularis]
MTPSLSSAVGISNLPNQRHKIVSRKGTNFTIMVVGESGLGKTTFVNTLFSSLIRDYKKPEHRIQKQMDHTVQIDVVRADIEENGFKVRLTIVDTPGFGDFINNQDCWVPVVDFIDEQHFAHVKHEEKHDRNKKDDLRVHVCLYFIPATGHTLRPLDIEVMKQLSSRVNLIPVISKADTLTPLAMASFKDRIRDCIAYHNIQVYTPPINHDDTESAKITNDIMAAMPYSVLGSETDVQNAAGETVKGRQYLWGTVEVENEKHSDFVHLRNLIIRSHMSDLIESTEEIHYEKSRSLKLTQSGKTDDDPQVTAKKNLETLMKNEEESLRKKFTEQVRLEETRFRKWEQRLIAERDRLNKDLENQHKSVKALEEEVDELIAKKNASR